MEDRFLGVYLELVGIRRVARLRYSLDRSEVIGQWSGSVRFHGWDAGFSYVLCFMVQMVWWVAIILLLARMSCLYEGVFNNSSPIRLRREKPRLDIIFGDGRFTPLF